MQSLVNPAALLRSLRGILRAAVFFVISLGAHALFFGALVLSEPLALNSSMRERVVSIELIDARRADPREARERLREINKERPVVTQVDLPHELEARSEPKTRVRFLSRERRRVAEETRVVRTGDSQNRNTKAAEPKASRETAAHSLAGDLSVPKSREHSALDPQSRPFSALVHLSRVSSESQLAERLPPELRTADMTALNTDATLFYSFYQRGREATYWRWTRFVRATLAQQRLDTSRMGLDREYTTVYEMQLDSGGQFLRGVLLQSSGVQRLDEAALLAFAQARSFPNPPAEMIDADGLIRWVWSFTVEANPLVAGP